MADFDTHSIRLPTVSASATSVTPFVSPVSRSVASVWKATYRPASWIAGCDDGPLPAIPARFTETSWVESRMGRSFFRLRKLGTSICFL